MRIFEIKGTDDLKYLMLSGIFPNPGCTAQSFLKSTNGMACVSIQLMAAENVAGCEHILTAALLAAKSWGSKKNVSRSPATEILLYSSGKRQIKEAIASMGAGNASSGWVVIAVSSDKVKLQELSCELSKYGKEDDSIIAITSKKAPNLIEKFGISECELSIAGQLSDSSLKALTSLILEKVSLSELYR
jgi:KEOPS complex subunit Cgi121